MVNTEMKVNLDQLEIKAGDDVSPVLDEGESCAERICARVYCSAGGDHREPKCREWAWPPEGTNPPSWLRRKR